MKHCLPISSHGIVFFNILSLGFTQLLQYLNPQSFFSCFEWLNVCLGNLLFFCNRQQNGLRLVEKFAIHKRFSVINLQQQLKTRVKIATGFTQSTNL
jgi:hypothetical protein